MYIKDIVRWCFRYLFFTCAAIQLSSKLYSPNSLLVRHSGNTVASTNSLHVRRLGNMGTFFHLPLVCMFSLSTEKSARSEYAYLQNFKEKSNTYTDCRKCSSIGTPLLVVEFSQDNYQGCGSESLLWLPVVNITNSPAMSERHLGSVTCGSVHVVLIFSTVHCCECRIFVSPFWQWESLQKQHQHMRTL